MTDKKLHERALKQFQRDLDDESECRREAAQDMDFRAGNAWDERIKAARIADGKPCLDFNRTHVFIASIANENRQNKPQCKVNPISSGATAETAKVINGILRHVQYRSQADTAYDCALDQATGSSFGYVRAVSEYLEKSNDQEIRILPVTDPFSIYGVLMPAVRGQKCRHAFVIETLSREEYEAEYGDGPGEEPTNWEADEWASAGHWLDGENVRIAEYWYEELETKTLRHVQMPDGSTEPVYTDEKGYSEKLPFLKDDDGKPVERDEQVATVKFCKMDGTRIIPGTSTTWVGDTIPIDAVLGQLLVKQGKVHLFSLIRFVRDAQCLINVYKSEIALKIGLSNKVPYIGYKGQFTDPKWRDANWKNYPYLEAELVTLPNGQVAPLPQRQQLEEQIQALSVAAAQEIDDMKSGMGIYDASLGAKGNETSGLAIGRRQNQASVANFHFGDNLARTMWSFAAKLLKIIPKIYDRPGRQVRIVGEDLAQSVVTVNKPYIDPDTGQRRHYPLDVGEYDVVVTIGPSYTTARLEGADTLGQVFKAAPNAFPLLGDLWIGSMDYTWADEGARRLKLAAPQNIVQEQDPNGPQQIPPQVQQQMQQMQQKLATTEAFAQSLHEQIQTKSAELASKEKISAEQELTKRTLGLATIDQLDAITKLKEELNIVHRRMDAQQAQQQLASQQAHQAGLQGGAQQHEAAQQASTQQHQQGMQADAQQASADSQASAQDHAAAQQTDAQQAAADAADQAAQNQPEAA